MAQLTTMARPYAKAAFEMAVTSDRLDAWSAMLSLLAALLQHAKVAAYLASPVHNAGHQAKTLIELCGSELDDSGRNFVALLAGNKRLVLLPEIVRMYEELKAERQRTVDVEVVSAFAMNEEAQQKLGAALKRRLQREVKLNMTVDKSLIGGLVVRAGDLVIDGSVRGKLNKLTETMHA
jgi:F-type H+-transporting ATPase subunit delta